MQVRLPELLAKLMGKKMRDMLEIDDSDFTWKKYADIDLRKIKTPALHEFRDAIEPHIRKVRGGRTLLKDIDTWLAVIEKGAHPKARTVRQFSSILKEIIRNTPGHRIFMRNDNLGGVWLCYYVNEIEYHPEQKDRDNYHPAYCEMEIMYHEFKGRHSKTLSWRAEECVGRKPLEILANSGVYLETTEYRKEYLKDIKRYKVIIGKIGRQYLARGMATDDLDGNPRTRDEDRYGWLTSDSGRVILDRTGEPSRVVIDVFTESDKEQHEDRAYLKTYFWDPQEEYDEDDDEEEPDELLTADDPEIKARDKKAKSDRDEEREELPEEDQDPKPKVIEVPIHPLCAVFDLQRHLRLRVHISGLELYEYDPKMADRIILPPSHRDLVDMLVSHQGVFKDIVHGKGGGITVLLAGPPGTGKTLTAEVYAEAMKRPLYSVQCSQLGTNPTELEAELLKVFTRSQRWNAILLLDEADVYVHERGSDLDQNAIVGVFLRVLEYYAGVLFFTTNRSDLVDDAISSRCIARIDYPIPPPEDQTKIWLVLSEVMGIKVPRKVIDDLVKAHPSVSGRDVKNLLKLAKLVSEAKSQPVTFESVEFARRFKPTVGEERDKGG